MKNKIQLIGVILLSTLITFTSCKKERMVQTPDELLVLENKVISLIKQFDQKLNSSFKSDEKIEIDSAVWNIEALQNYTLAYPDSAAKDSKVIKTTYTVPVDANGMILMTDVQVVYDLMESDLITSLDLIESEIKYIRFSDVALDSIIGGTAYMSITAGFGFNWLMNTYWGFGADDDWIWGTPSEGYNPPAGKCDGTQIGVSDGSNELAWRLNNPLVLPANTSYMDLVTITGYATDFPQDNGPGYRLYLDQTTTIDRCLYNEDLEYYLLEADDIIKTNEDDGGLCPPNKAFVSIEIIDDMIPWGSNSAYCHTYYVTYGTPYNNIQH